MVGSIECGKYADFAVLEHDPLAVPSDKLKDVGIWGPVVGGQVRKAPRASIPSASPTPMTVIGGVRGAGKTAFLNRLLAATTARYAVLVNDFGEINIDAGLIERHDGATMSLTNGCVCCSIGAGFLETLGRLLDSGERFDRFVIEASGVGDPWRIAEIAVLEPGLRLDGVIVLADATRIGSLVHDRRVGETVRNQFAKCDVVLLSKHDLVTPDGLNDARRVVRAIRPDARVEVFSRDARLDRFLARPPAGNRDFAPTPWRMTYPITKRRSGVGPIGGPANSTQADWPARSMRCRPSCCALKAPAGSQVSASLRCLADGVADLVIVAGRVDRHGRLGTDSPYWNRDSRSATRRRARGDS